MEKEINLNFLNKKIGLEQWQLALLIIGIAMLGIGVGCLIMIRHYNPIILELNEIIGQCLIWPSFS